MLMVTYVAEHLEQFDVDELAIRGEERSVVSEKLLRAVHEVWDTMTEEEWRGRGPDPARVRHLAETKYADRKD